MEAALQLILYALQGSVGILAALTLGTWWLSWRLKQHFTGLLMRWEKPEFGLWTAILFLLLLVCVSGGMLSYAFMVRHDGLPNLIPLWKEITYTFVGLSGLIGLFYSGLRPQFFYVVSERGLYQTHFRWQYLRWQVELVPWELVYDYYVVEEEALVTFNLVLRDRRRITLQAPIHLRDTIERIIEYGSDKYSFLHKYGRKIARPSQ
ncbi:MAG: hypothetical protein NZ580_05835 [Bacteroidia bacterium]|nr:hypothetical protein [Bacteroidia bacterium]MDW8236146.1 hypothetical protein [Bacteroidia bacterium]